MIDPILTLQDAIATALITSATISEHITPDRIRAGGIRPDDMPSLLFSPGQVNILGRAAGGQIVAEVRLMVNLWAVQDDTDTAQIIAGAVLAALMDAPKTHDCRIDDWDRPALTWVPDPDPAMSFAHGAFGIRAVVRWKVDNAGR